MSKSDAFEADLLKLIFNGTAIGNLADNAASSPLGSLYVALHTADPGEAGTQSTSECTYTGYARIAVARTSGGWAVTGTSPTKVSPVANIVFGACSAGVQTATHFSIGTTLSSAGKVLYSGPLNAPIAISPGVQPFLTTDTVVTED